LIKSHNSDISSKYPHSDDLQENRFDQHLENIGYRSSQVAGPVMAAGILHGVARNVSSTYPSRLRGLSGFSIFWTGLALRIIGNTVVNNYKS